MIELDSEINTKYKNLRNYLRKNNVVEAKLRLVNGTVITYSQPSQVHGTLIDLLYNSKQKHKIKNNKQSKQNKSKMV